jgi:hypothetical protein
MGTPRASGQRLYLPTADTSTAFDLTAGRRPLTNVSGLQYVGVDGATAGVAPHRVVWMDEFRGAQFQFFTSAANDQTANFRVWLVTPAFEATEPSARPNPANAVECDLSCLIADTSTLTFSTATGPTAVTGLLASTVEIADTITFTLATTATTPAGPGTVIGGAYQLGDIDEFSPTGNVPATLYVPDFGAGVWGFVFDFDRTGCSDVNALYQLTK